MRWCDGVTNCKSPIGAIESGSIFRANFLVLVKHRLVSKQKMIEIGRLRSSLGIELLLRLRRENGKFISPRENSRLGETLTNRYKRRRKPISMRWCYANALICLTLEWSAMSIVVTVCNEGANRSRICEMISLNTFRKNLQSL